MTTQSDVEDRFASGQLTILLSPDTAPLESCVDVLRAAGIQSSVERLDFAGEQLVKAAIPRDHRPSSDDIEESKRVVARVLDRSDISHQIRGVGYETPDRSGAPSS